MPCYSNAPAALNAANAWMMLQTAQLLEQVSVPSPRASLRAIPACHPTSLEYTPLELPLIQTRLPAP